MPITEAWKPTLDSKATIPKSFELTTEARSELHQDALKTRCLEAEAEAKKAFTFHAKPAKVLSAPAFAPRKSTKPLTEISESNVPFANSVERQERRKELEKQLATKRVQMEAEAERKAKEKAMDAARDLKALRASMVPPKARGVPNGAPFVVKKTTERARKATVPISPKLNTTFRSTLRAA